MKKSTEKWAIGAALGLGGFLAVWYLFRQKAVIPEALPSQINWTLP